MPDETPTQVQSASAECGCAHAQLPCAGAKSFRGLRFMPRCLNCRREVEASMSRIGGRRLRKLRAMPECSAEQCVAFLRSLRDEAMRLHMASMAWWRFSSEGEGVADAVLAVLSQCKAKEPGSGVDYMRRALRALSPLSQAQLAVWFGCENLYQAASLFAGERQALMGRHCHICRLYKLGCDAYDKLGADACTLWDDQFVQGVAAAVKKAGGLWRDPCNGIDDEGKGPGETDKEKKGESA